MRAMATSTPVKETAPVGAIDRYFKITERGSTIGQEIRGGLVTFFAMAYIVVLNPLIIGTVADSQGGFIGGDPACQSRGWRRPPPSWRAS